MLISNNSNHYKYFNKVQKQFIEINTIDIENNLHIDCIINNRLNTRHHIDRPDRYNEIIKNIVPIPPKSSWLLENNKFEKVNRIDFYKDYNYNLNGFLDLTNLLVRKLANKRICIELSGGLDSSIIICVLKHFNIDFNLVGLRSNNYEFRTERTIQDLFYVLDNSILINSKLALPFSNLKYSPKHPLPSFKSLFHNQKKIIAETCQKNSIDILINGVVGDAVFCDSPKNNLWESWEFDDNWFGKYVFEPYGIHYLQTNCIEILDYLYYARKNESHDPFKVWAREFFKPIIPSQLSNYYFKADHNEEYLEGIFNSQKDILFLLDYLYDFLGIANNSSYFEKIKKINFNTNDYNDFLADLSLGNWIYSLRNKK